MTIKDWCGKKFYNIHTKDIIIVNWVYWFTVGWEYEIDKYRQHDRTKVCGGKYVKEDIADNKNHYWHYRTFAKHFKPIEEN